MPSLVRRYFDELLEKDPFAYSHGLSGVDQVGNYRWVNLSLILFAVICFAFITLRILKITNSHIRHMACIGSNRQGFWLQNQTSWWPWLKKHLVYAPLGKKVHNKEMQLSRAISMGTLPTRFHFLLLVAYSISNIAYMLALPWGRPGSDSVAAALRGRSGTLSALNLIPTFLFALRNNPLIPLLNISYDTFNLFHRWAARIVILEALIHTLCWFINCYDVGKWHGVAEALKDPSYGWGMVGTACFVFIAIQAWSPIRHAFYETFINGHRVVVLFAFVGVYVHIDVHQLPQLPWMEIVIILWASEWVLRIIRIIYFNISTRHITRITVEALPSDACRVTLDLVRPWKARPGCHVHLYVPTISLWASHPFSVAWYESRPDRPVSEKLPMSHAEIDLDRKENFRTAVSLIVRRRHGFTDKLWEKAAASPGGTMKTWGAIEGPYGGHDSLASYGTLLLFAGGVGITHQVSYVKSLIAGYNAGTVAARKIVLVWSIPNSEMLEWVRPWMDEILKMPGRRDVLKTLLFITKPKSHAEIVSNSGTLLMFPGRCNAQQVLDREIVDRVGAMAVTVCGPGAFADDVRAAVRRRVDVGCIDFIEEAFTY